MINRNLKDGSQAGWNAGGIGWNQTDECRHPNINLDTNKDINKDSVFTLALPYFPSPGPETVIDEPGRYKGYFCAVCPGTGRTFDYVPPVDWNVISCVDAEFGGHGCCYNCYVVLVELEYIGAEIEEPSPFIKYGIIGIALLAGLKLLNKK